MKTNRWYIPAFLWTLLALAPCFSMKLRAQERVRVDLYVRDTVVTFGGLEKHAYSVNGQIPMPELHFTEGDTAEIYVHNELDSETSIHWHGLILPNQEDGVPYLTTAPIRAHSTHRYFFPLVQNGTYWYHSHTGVQEQSGMYGAFIIHPREETSMPEYVIILSDWTNMKPGEVQRRLHMANDWSAIKKAGIQRDAAQTYGDAIREKKLSVKLRNEWKRMLAMDVSDVYYDAFLANGKPRLNLENLPPGQEVKLRIINGSSSTYFWLQYSYSPLKIVASDGMNTVPVEVDRMIIAVAETYDLIITAPPAPISAEFRATSEDRIGSASVWLNQGLRYPANPLKPLYYFEGMEMMNDMMKMNGDLDDMNMQMSLQQMDMNVVMYPEIRGEKMADDAANRYNSNALSDIVTLNYNMLQSPEKTVLPPGPVRTFHFTLTGNMNRYVWSLDNKVVSESDKIILHRGENIRLILTNNSMMRHPMHLHGHFFRVVNQYGDYAPLKNVLDIMPMETDTIEFHASESGDWFFHCHILYHMMSGMGRIFTYDDSPVNPQLENPKKALRKVYADDRMLHAMFENDLASNGNDGEAMLQNTRFNLQAEWRIGYSRIHGYEIETHFGRYFGKMQWLLPYIGIDWRNRTKSDQHAHDSERNLFQQDNTKNSRRVFCLGLQYVLPMLIRADIRIDTQGRWRFQLMREDIPVSKRMRFNFMINSDKEYMFGLRYLINRNFAVSTHLDSDMGPGVGITFTY